MQTVNAQVAVLLTSIHFTSLSQKYSGFKSCISEFQAYGSMAWELFAYTVFLLPQRASEKHVQVQCTCISFTAK